MISAPQRDVLALLAELCELSPDVRLGQLLAHLGFLGEDQTGRSLWDIDDEQLLAVLQHHRGELVGRTGDATAGLTLAGGEAPSVSDAGSPSTAAGR